MIVDLLVVLFFGIGRFIDFSWGWGRVGIWVVCGGIFWVNEMFVEDGMNCWGWIVVIWFIGLVVCCWVEEEELFG